MIKYAGFPIRFLAYLFEPALYWLILAYAVSNIAASSTLADVWGGLLGFIVFVSLPFALISFLLKPYFSSTFGGNIGKLITGLRVEDSDHNKLSFKRSLFRYTAGYIFSSILLFSGFFWIFKDPKKQAFHDKAVGSYVIIRQTLWPLSLALLILMLFGSGYFFNQAFNKAMAGPLKFEAVGLFLQYQQGIKPQSPSSTLPLPASPESSSSALPKTSSSSTTPGTKKTATNVIFVLLKDPTTAAEANPIIVGLQSNPSVTSVQYLTKDQAIQAYQSVAPGHTLPVAQLSPVLIVYLKNTQNNSGILSELKSNPLVIAAYPYSF